MLFKFKKSEIDLDCFTDDPVQYEVAKIRSGKAFFPEWFKKTSLINKEYDGLTIKGCNGLKDFYSASVIIPSWFSMVLEIIKNQNNTFEYSVNFSEGGPEGVLSHGSFQYEHFKTDFSENFKIDNPWYFKTKEDIKFVWSQPTWSHPEMLSVLHLLPAVVDFKYQSGTNISWMITAQAEYKKIEIDPLDALVALHPMTEKEIKIHNHLVDSREIDRIYGYDMIHKMRSGTFMRNKRQRKIKYFNKLEEIEKKCPVNSTNHLKNG